MIGVFDSGFGGLTVLSALLEKLPEYDYLYLGDAARAPYGNHSAENVREFTEEGVKFLFERGARLVVLACNTASANALYGLQEDLIRTPKVTDRNVLGVIVPIAEAIADSRAQNIALIGTRGTVKSGRYQEEIEARMDGVTLHQKACPLLVPLIEEGWADKMETQRILKFYLRDLKSKNPDILVPACTHYPILQKKIQQIMGKKVKILDTGAIVAEKMRDYIERHPEYTLSKGKQRQFFTTDNPDYFQTHAKPFLGHPIEHVEQVHL